MDRADGTRSAIAEAALRLFREQGYDTTTMDTIAAEAGVSKATLYRYVTGKAALRDLLGTRLDGATIAGRDARALILDAAIALIAQQGVARTTLEEIAASAGVSKGAIYWHFKGKADLFAAIVADYSPLPRILRIIQEGDDAPFEQLVTQVYDAYLDFFGEHVALFRAIFAEVQVNPELAALFQRNVLGPLFTVLGDYFERNAARIGVRPIHPVLAFQALFGPLVMHLLTRETLDERFGLRFERHELTDTFLGIFFHGIEFDPNLPDGGSPGRPKRREER